MIKKLISHFERLSAGGYHSSRRLTSGRRLLAAEVLEVRQLLAAEPIAAGRAQDLLLIVNPHDENAVRVANAYQALRSIPERNIVFFAAPSESGFTNLNLDNDSFMQAYLTPLWTEIQNRGLAQQIDFIGALGQTQSFSTPGDFQSLSYFLTQLPQYASGMSVTSGQQTSFGIGANSSQPSLFDVVHSTENFTVFIDGGAAQHRYYMGGIVGATNRLGNTVDQVIQGLTRSVHADGTHPVGTIYLEENDDVRSNTREPQWPAIRTYFAARGVTVSEESDTPGFTPQNRNNVRGAVVGYPDLTLPNGSTYLPGSWADNLTSYGANFLPGQTKATEFIAAGAAGSSGTVEEPFALQSRFPNASIFGGIDSGLTLAESFYQSVADPDLQQFFGDLLAQPYADLPIITFTAAPANNAVVSGSITVSSSASLPAGSRATAVSRMELWVDGQLASSSNGANSSFSVNTTSLSDGMHEFRVIAIANNAAASESIAVRSLDVRNRGQNIQTGSTSYSGAASETLAIPVSTQAGSGTIARVEFRHLGRVVATAAGPAASISLPLSSLAYGDNSITPVAVFTDGSVVRGRAISVTRTASTIAGQSVTPVARRTAGIKAEYFLGKGGTSIAASNFTGTPDITRTHRSLYIEDGPNADDQLATPSIDKLAVRFTGRFIVTAENAGETLFSLIRTNDSVRLSIDGQSVMSWNNLSYGHPGDSSVALRLGEGEHSFELLVANTGSGTDPGFNIDLRMRGGDGITRIMNDQIAFTANATSTTLSPPQITAPGKTTAAQRPVFTWVPASGATQTELWISNLSTRTSPVIQTTVTGATYSPIQDLGIGKFRVWMRSVTADGQKSAWSAPVDFAVTTAVVLKPLPAVQLTYRPVIEWQLLRGAVKYDVWINNLSTGQSPIFRDQSMTATNMTPTQDLPIGRYRVWVRGIDAAGVAAAWSLASDFQVVVAPVPVAGFGENTSAAFFTHDFESLDPAAFNAHHTNSSGWNFSDVGGFTNIGFRNNIGLVGSESSRSGSQSLQITYTQNEDYGGAEVLIPGGSDFIRTTQYMRFGSTYDFAFGQKVHRIRSFNTATDRNNFDMALVIWGRPLPGRAPGDMTGQNEAQLLSINANGGPFDWGSAEGAISINREQWYELITEVRLNAPGQANGSVRLILNGDIIAERTDVQFRDTAEHKLNNVMFGGWYSNGAAGQNPSIDPATPSTILIDDVRIETSPSVGSGGLATSTFDRTPEFRWTSSTGTATSEIYLRNLNTGVTTVQQKNIIGNSWTPAIDLPDGPYRWWVANYNAQGFRSNWSAPVDVFIGGRSRVVNPSGPTNNRRPELTWQHVDGAVRYELWVNRVDVPGVIINETTLTGVSYVPASPLAAGAYRAWIRAVSANGETSVWSLPSNFQVT